MCANRKFEPGAFCETPFYKGYQAADRLTRFWDVNYHKGIAAIWTSWGPCFFDMAKTSPVAALLQIKAETGADWATVADWVNTVSNDDLH